MSNKRFRLWLASLTQSNLIRYVFHTTGNKIADLYGKYGEQLLQQNIRVYQGDKSTNASIRETCVGDQSANFFHFNNGITFLCETAGWDQFTAKVSISKAQIVNGGQTARVIYQACKDAKLKNDVLIPIRVITSQGDKEFASNVAVNLNNQNKVESSFLRSNHPHIVQLSNSLATLGWYLERREGEIKSLTDGERQLIENKIGNCIEGNFIKLKEGTQAFAATFYRQPELAKKNPKLLFLSRSDGGHFERLFSSELTAENFLYASKLKNFVDIYVKKFGVLKRKKSRVDNWEEDYRHFFPSSFFEEHRDVIDQFIPQSSVFLTAAIFEKYIRIRGKNIDELLIEFESKPDVIILNTLSLILNFARNNPNIANKSWPTLLKSQSFFTHVCSYIAGLEEQNAEQSY